MNLQDIANDKYSPTGDLSVGYPQIFIRTNRSDGRTDINKIVALADEAANKYPAGDPERATAVTEVLTKEFGSGKFGHSWIVVFNSDKPGDCTTYGYHEGYGYIKNGTASDTNDSPERKYHLGYAFKVDSYDVICSKIENELVPILNLISALIGWAMGNKDANIETGAYTPVNNCTWFAGEVWMRAVGYPLSSDETFKQAFDGEAHADNWSMPYLKFITSIADPGMLAETLQSLGQKK